MSGTSTLWNILTSNPAITWVGYGKESFFFSGEIPSTTQCDNLVEEFQRQTAEQRLIRNRTDLIVGDWSATHFSCSCCPLSLKTLNENLKIIVVLRDPVQRAISRFMEQKRNERMPFHNLVVNFTFAEYAEREAAAIEACVARAAPLRQPRSGGAPGQEPPLAGLLVTFSVTGFSSSSSDIVGWSVYDVFLENYLAHFSKEQVRVLYTDDLAAKPLESVRQVEAFLGAPPHTYDPNVVSMVYNSRECYHWRCGRKRGEIQTQSTAEVAASSSSSVSSPSSADGGDGGYRYGPKDGPFAQARSRLVRLYRPHMQRLFAWADKGIIAQPPAAWRSLYA
ncbi:hypothetical protein VOLCADRAFT_97069 [Volvox carteri f. nagariensis]|uniref:Sulfotransferase n=1 Tax=Volvox carteri f. nagariensis TaxID=3068 RepID=D8UBT7_VOLCA|nr:uncharacterized protein VOLCADRAFT_97069 [Volvox carteri f. nagariensis]EFJ42880.1 hypothetical protein VOLCADRAFT_97069 [Volvox carteri f. nagariensis]|eukprot:XP_002956140.1 hypothetical protein VOLCADRAFT_97069 [Volvox carteri f. nagariensis]